jgi:hypothetical protein
MTGLVGRAVPGAPGLPTNVFKFTEYEPIPAVQSPSHACGARRIARPILRPSRLVG